MGILGIPGKLMRNWFPPGGGWNINVIAFSCIFGLWRFLPGAEKLLGRSESRKYAAGRIRSLVRPGAFRRHRSADRFRHGGRRAIVWIDPWLKTDYMDAARQENRDGSPHLPAASRRDRSKDPPESQRHNAYVTTTGVPSPPWQPHVRVSACELLTSTGNSRLAAGAQPASRACADPG